jgi:YD repeat-containing protein
VGNDEVPKPAIDPDAARYTLDELGRPATRSDATGDWQFAWDHADRLAAVSTPGGDRWLYRYDAFGRRIAKQRYGTTGALLEETAFVWSGDLLVEQHHTESGGKVTTTAWDYHPELADPIAQITDGTVHAVVAEVAGAPAEVVGVDGTRTGDAAPLRLGGRYLDTETGLEFDRSRYFDPATARFLLESRTAPAPAS